ncbi:hypothetical protein RX327_24345 [Bradyrhizobium sp. BEA-2-5]|uniref:hypothetical protein n=1 Tax=Bradyrhizobium sp. BEA-2-5 TaxID=3080015 RepID=UPI00293EEF4E|nr:hypothetical protein [Bradyrhizobium sp. BEA-2-5]WOH79035.1 hypothetical protein RX327_24345 [Bradyrhizobium sp. BEA-2-5]
MTGLQRLLIRGSEKVIGHYQFLLDSATSEQERERYRRRIEEERRLLSQLLDHGDQSTRAA